MVNTKSSFLKKVTEENMQKPYRKNNSQVSDVSKDFQAQTLYVGSRGRNTKVHLRIYNKKEEQLS